MEKKKVVGLIKSIIFLICIVITTIIVNINNKKIQKYGATISILLLNYFFMDFIYLDIFLRREEYNNIYFTIYIIMNYIVNNILLVIGIYIYIYILFTDSDLIVIILESYDIIYFILVMLNYGTKLCLKKRNLLAKEKNEELNEIGTQTPLIINS